MRAIISLELVFYKDYNLLIYLKIIIAKSLDKAVNKDAKELESDLTEDKSLEDKLLDINKGR